MKEVPGCVSLASCREGQRSSVRRQEVTGRALAAVFLGRFTVGTWRNDGPAWVSVSAWQRCWSWFVRALLACRWLSERDSSGKQTAFCRMRYDGETRLSSASPLCYLIVGLVTQCVAMADAVRCDGQRSVLRCRMQRSALHDAPYCMFPGSAIRLLSCSSPFPGQPSWAVCFESFRNLLRWIPFTLSFAPVLHSGKVVDARVVA